MKGFSVALVLLMVLTSGERWCGVTVEAYCTSQALKCYSCIAQEGNVCNLYVQRCVNGDVSVRAWLMSSTDKLIRSCYKKADCDKLLSNDYVSGTCCETSAIE